MDNNTVYEWILQSTFTVAARERSLKMIEPYLTGLVQADNDVLDLCCGSGYVSFWCEARGARVIGVDLAPYMIALAREEARNRNSAVEFIEADILSYQFGVSSFDVVACIDSLSDFPLAKFAQLAETIASTLRPGGRLVLKYADGNYKCIRGEAAREGVYQEAPERITYRFIDYLPEHGAKVNLIRNETRGEEYERRGYLYSVPVVHLVLSRRMQLERHVVLAENQFLDIFVKPETVDGER